MLRSHALIHSFLTVIGNEQLCTRDYFLDFTFSLPFLSMGQSQEENQRQKKKKVDRYNILRKGKIIFWNVTERELFDIMEDLAVETYYNKNLTANDISYEPACDLDEKTA